jgi:hypothetical protein
MYGLGAGLDFEMHMKIIRFKELFRLDVYGLIIFLSSWCTFWRIQQSGIGDARIIK